MTFSRATVVACLLLGLLGISVAQVPAEQQAEMAINAARKAYNEGNLPAAREQFKQFLLKFGGAPQATSARYGLALSFMNAPEQDFAAALEPLNQATGDGNFADRGMVFYHLAVCNRALGIKEIEKGVATPAEIPQRKQAADGKFNDAARRFSEARDWFVGKKNDEWAGRCRCDQAEMELRANRIKEAKATCEPFTKDPAYAKNKYRSLGLYYHGVACFVDRDFAMAGRSLNQIAPFTDPAFGNHARYLVGRVLHLNGENAEASVHYDAVLADHDKVKKDAVEQLKTPDKFKGNPAEKSRLQILATGAAPEHVTGATFHGATLAYEAGKFADALGKFQAFAKDFPASALLPDAALRVGFCLVQLKQYEEAGKALAPLVDKFPKLADQSMYWLAKSQVGIANAADPNNPADRETKLKIAQDTFRKAADKANQLAQQGDPDARTRRGEMLLELGDTLQLSKQFAPAVQVFEQVWNEQLLPERRREEALQRLACGFGLANNLDRSDQLCNEFKVKYPQSTLSPAVIFRIAENSYARAQEVAKSTDVNRAPERKQKFDETAKKFLEVVEKYPEFERVQYARYGIGVCLSQNGDLDGAAKILDAIPAPDRNGELSQANYLLADCLIRLAPTKADDALAENIIREKLTNASGLLENYVASNPKSVDAPDALMKLGLCLKRLGSTLADPNERNQLLNKSREFYEKLAKDYPQAAQVGHARIEIAKVRALMGDRGGAMNDLRQFAGGTLQQSPVAPLALVQLATLHREQNQAAEAAKVMEEARKKYEAPLAQDKERAEWAHLLKYHHGVALFESGKIPESKQLFEEVTNAAKGKVIGAEAAMRAGQASIFVGKKLMEMGRAEKAKPNLKPDQIAAADRTVQQGKEAIIQAGEQLERRCVEFAQAMPGGEPRARMLYEAAWAYRPLAEEELTAAREAARLERVRKWTEEAIKALPAGGKPPAAPTVDIPAGKLPVQACEERTFNAYKKLVDEFADLALTVDARFELAELRADRDEHDTAIKLLKEALDKEPSDRVVSPDLLERVRLKLGASLFAKKEYKAAQTQFETVAGNEKSPHRGQAIYRQAEAMYAQGDFVKTAEKLAIFRDNGNFHNIGGVSDRAMLRLGQAYAAAKNWEAARQTFDAMLARYGNSPFAIEGRYSSGWVLQNQSKFDEAVAAYQLVVNATTSEIAAKAQLQIGLCRLAQKRFADASTALLMVPYTYDYPEIGYAAILEAARAFEEDKKPEPAAKLLVKLLKDAPADSEWAKAAKERLEKGKK